MAGGTAWGHQADVTRDADLEWHCPRGAQGAGAGIDVLVNNAGIGCETPLLEIPADEWDRVVATNLRAVPPVPARRARDGDAGGGAIVHIASIDASGGDGPYASYNASKAGLLGLNRTMALELAPHGIRVNCVSPGFTHTDMTEEAVPPGLMDYL